MKVWSFPAGAGTTRYFVAANLGANSYVSLVAPAGFTVARWPSGDVPSMVRGQWISPMSDLEVVVDGDVYELDVQHEEELVERERSRHH